VLLVVDCVAAARYCNTTSAIYVLVDSWPDVAAPALCLPPLDIAPEVGSGLLVGIPAGLSRTPPRGSSDVTGQLTTNARAGQGLGPCNLGVPRGV
jgi:hypothetical protein